MCTGSFTAQAFITTDLDDNQITAFHPGAMTQSHQNKVADAQDVALGIISPDGRDGMLQHAREFKAAGIPFVFDPGQGLPMFNGEELMAFLKLADYCTVNDYEARLLTERTGRTLEQLATEVEGAYCHPGRQRIAYLHQGPPHRDSRGAGGSPDRSHRLRRRLSRRPALRYRQGLGVAEDGPAGVADGLNQDRSPRRSESQADAG
jgi:sugar/nucleoside kinase (ribokinase family)